MSNTTIANVKLIAPELVDFLDAKAQKEQITVTVASTSANYTVTLNGNAITVNISATATTTLTIASALCTAIEASTSAGTVTTTNNGDGTFTLEAATAGTSFTLSVTTNLSVLNLQANVDNTDLVNLVLADVVDQVGSGLGTRQEICQRYLAAHYFTLINNATSNGGGIASESIGEHSISYNSISSFITPNRFDTTKYGLIYNEIAKRSTINFFYRR